MVFLGPKITHTARIKAHGKKRNCVVLNSIYRNYCYEGTSTKTRIETHFRQKRRMANVYEGASIRRSIGG
jgi:hypothetical protein